MKHSAADSEPRDVMHRTDVPCCVRCDVGSTTLLTVNHVECRSTSGHAVLGTDVIVCAYAAMADRDTKEQFTCSKCVTRIEATAVTLMGEVYDACRRGRRETVLVDANDGW